MWKRRKVEKFAALKFGTMYGTLSLWESGRLQRLCGSSITTFIHLQVEDS